MTLWTIQPIEWYEKLVKEQCIFGLKQYIEPDFSQAYQWLMNVMDEKIGQRPHPECYPIWSWYQYTDFKKKRPDLRSCAHLPKGTKGVRLEINKKESEVLLSDFHLWHHALNYWKINDCEEESEAFDRLLQSKNIKFIEKENYTEEIKQQVIQSWDKIVDMNYRNEYAAQPFERKSIQATFWSLSLQEIISAKEFIAR